MEVERDVLEQRAGRVVQKLVEDPRLNVSKVLYEEGGAGVSGY